MSTRTFSFWSLFLAAAILAAGCSDNPSTLVGAHPQTPARVIVAAASGQASPLPGGQGDVSFALLNNSLATVYEGVGTYCMSAIPPQYWGGFAVAPGQQLQWIAGAYDSGGCFASASTAAITVSASPSSSPQISIFASEPGLISFGLFYWSLGAGSTACIVSDATVTTMQTTNPSHAPLGSPLTLAVTVPAAGLGSC